MPAKLKSPIKFVKLRLYLEDVEYLEAHTENVAERVRELVHAYVGQMRKRLGDPHS